MKSWKYHCQILQIPEDSTRRLIKRAYRKRAMDLHPDRHANSPRAKEDFQQLSESYQYLLENFHQRPSKPEITEKIERPKAKPQPAKAPEAPRSGDAIKQKSVNTPPATVPSKLPLNLQLPIAPALFWRLASAAAAVFVFFLALHDSENAPDAGPSPAWTPSPVWSAAGPVPAAKPSYSNQVTEAPKAPRKLPCEIAYGKGSADPLIIDFTDTEEEVKCRGLCAQRAALSQDRELRCAWDGKDFFRRASVARDRAPPPQVAVATPAPAPSAPAIPPAPVVASAEANYRNICYMTVSLPGNVQAQAIPGETRASCFERCRSVVVQHPTDREVRCAYAGVEIVTHIPDRMDIFLSREPAAENETAPLNP